MPGPVPFLISDDGGIIGRPAAGFPRPFVADYRGVACSALGEGAIATHLVREYLGEPT
jgi:hypothetical protein